MEPCHVEKQVCASTYTDECLEEHQERAFIDNEYYVSEKRLSDSIRIPVSECIDIMSAVEQLVKNTFNGCESEVCTFDNENSVAVINEQYIAADLTGLMKILCSDCERDNSNCKKCHQAELTLQCLKCNEKFHHRFWAIRHLDFCQSSDDKSDRSLIKSPDFKCEICEKKFQSINHLRIHLQYCVRDSASRNLGEHTNLEEILALVNYLNNTSQVLKENIKKFGHQRFYEHYCTNCVKSIVDEVSINPIKCNNCKAMCLLQCHTCKCLHETHESIIEHLKNSFCGYQMQFFDSSCSFQLQEQQTPNHVTVKQQKDRDKRRQTRKSNKTSKTKTAITTPIIVYCPQCTKSEMIQKGLTKCRNCKASLVYRCNGCNIDVPTLKALELHQKSHLFKNYNMCSKCGRAFAQTKNIKMHEKVCVQSQTTRDDLISKKT